ncbi:Rz1-like lysis system protein LysC [Providencia stuartii]|uniref:Rz1-like lysis system protein LysC n=1 Tax=Providencia stuartii TaxID=588 RepID=UPI003AF32D26
MILLCPSLLLTGCTSTQTSYVPAQCTPIPATLTEPVLAPLPPDSDGKTLLYSQSILWIPLLLATIDKANQQLEAIRKIEGLRHSSFNTLN